MSNAQTQIVQVDNTLSDMFRQIYDNDLYLANTNDIKKSNQSILALFNMSDSKHSKKYSKYIPGLESTIYGDFEDYGTTHSEAAYVYLGTKWGGYIQWPDGLIINNYDPRVRDWYTKAIANPDQVVMSEPYISFDETHSLIISSSTAVKDSSGNIVGVMGIDVSLNKLSQIIRNIKIGNSGYAILYSKEGTILAHPDTKLNFTNINQLNQKDYKKFIAEGNTSFESTINGAPVLINVYSSRDTGWKMASVIQKSELTNRANKSGFFILLVTFSVLFLVIILIYIVTKNITKPITELTPLMDAAGNGNLEVRANIKTNDEFGRLGISFNLMMGNLSSAYQELLTVHEELTATEEELQAQYDELQFSEETLRNNDERYRLALEGTNDSIWQWDLVTGDFFASDKLYEIIGYTTNEDRNLTRSLKKIIHTDDLATAKKDLENHLNDITPIYKSEYRIKIKNGSYVWVSSRGKALRDSQGKAIKLSGSITDISDRKISEDKIKFMAFYDYLTKLPNRVLFMNILNDQLDLIKTENTEGAVFFIDLDNFKNINDTMGHDFGDMLLKYLAKKVERVVDGKDTLCRLGGDEFILLHPYLQPLDITKYTNNLLALFDNFFEIDNKQIFITASIGVAIYPKDGSDANSILKNADAAMYKAKALGKNRVALYDEKMYLQLERKTCIERILRTSIENKELSLNYQPQYDAMNNEIFGFEALVRLNSKELGFISPVEFIPIAEESGLISQLDLWVLNEACTQSVKWLREGFKFKSISINISSVDIQQADFLKNIKSIFEKTGIDTRIVELEITETALMQSLDSNIKILNKLRDMGIRLALDDFGTGYSSLNYLRKIPISTLKIDKTFIDNITSNIKEEAIINSIIQMAHSMGLKVVAEGVEKEEQLAILKKRKCDYIQGYYFSRPLPTDDIEKLLI